MLIRFAVRNVGRNRRRSAVAVSTIAVGVFGLLFLQAFFSGLFSLHADASIHGRYGHGQITTKGYWDRAFEKPSDHWLEAPEPLLKELRAHPSVLEAFPRVQFFALLSNDKVNVAGRGQGIDGVLEQSFFNKMNFVDGGPLGATGDGIVLGIGLARSLSVGMGDRVTVLGQTVDGTMNAVDTTVVGIFHAGMKEADDALFQVQLDQAQKLLGSDRIESIAVGLKSDDEAVWDRFEEDVTKRFVDVEALSVYVIDQAWADNGRKFLAALFNVFRLTMLGMILLAIYNSASSTVMERKRELGMLRANGESPGDIVRLIMSEGLVIALLGAAVGVLMILMTAKLMTGGIPMPPTPGTNRVLPVLLDVQTVQVLTSAALGVAMVMLAMSMSAWQVVRLSIADAIRSAR